MNTTILLRIALILFLGIVFNACQKHNMIEDDFSDKLSKENSALESDDGVYDVISNPETKWVSVGFSSTKVPIMWTVVENITKNYRVISHDVVTGYRSSTGSYAVIYDLRHDKTVLGGITTIFSTIPPYLPIANISWTEGLVLTDIADDYRSGTIDVNGELRNFGVPFYNASQRCTVKVQ